MAKLKLVIVKSKFVTVKSKLLMAKTKVKGGERDPRGGESKILSGMGQGLEAYRHLARTRQGEEVMAVGSRHVISKDDDRILKLTYDLALGKISQVAKGVDS
jgi:hypothetical protein